MTLVEPAIILSEFPNPLAIFSLTVFYSDVFPLKMFESSVVALAFNTNTLEAEAGRSQ